MVILEAVELITGATSELGAQIASQSALFVTLIEVGVFVLAIIGLRRALKIRERFAACSLGSFATGCLLWLLLVEFRGVAQAALAGKWFLIWSTLAEAFAWAIQSKLCWPAGFVIGAGLLRALRASPAELEPGATPADNNGE